VSGRSGIGSERLQLLRVVDADAEIGGLLVKLALPAFGVAVE
jgi:hypothetical protein